MSEGERGVIEVALTFVWSSWNDPHSTGSWSRPDHHGTMPTLLAVEVDLMY